VRFHIEQRFGLSAQTVCDAMTDAGFASRMSGLPRLGRPELVERREDPDRIVTLIRYAFVGDLNQAVRRVIDPARLSWVEEAVCDRTTLRTTFRILPDHYAQLIACQGTTTLTAVQGGTSRSTDGELKVHVPLVGAKVERAILSGLEEHAAAVIPVVADWAADTGRT